eukprot:14510913-Ditylum_brightwellii.AAC.1
MECNMNTTTVTKFVISHSTEASSQHCPRCHPALQDGHDHGHPHNLLSLSFFSTTIQVQTLSQLRIRNQIGETQI